MVTKQRRRLIATLFAGNALSSISYIGAITVASLVAQTLTGREDLSGLPSMIAILGTAVGAVAMTRLSRRTGRRPAFVLGYALAAAGAGVSLAAVLSGKFGVFLLGMALLGFGRSVGQLSRYAAGDLVTADKRGKAISFVVWAATIGAIVSPLLIAPSGRVLLEIAGNELAGALTVAFVGFSIAAVTMAVFLRPEPMTLIVDGPITTRAKGTTKRAKGATAQAKGTTAEATGATTAAGSSTPFWRLMTQPGVPVALTTLAITQLVMVMVMTMTPLHLRAHGQGLGMIGWVMMAHTAGMFGIAPLTGVLVDWVGTRKITAVGMAVLGGGCALAATASDAEPAILLTSLFLLGVGWNFGFIAGSAALTEHVHGEDRLRLQGFADSLTWIFGGVGALASGLILSVASYPALGHIAALLTLGPVVMLIRTRGQKTAS